MNSRTGSAAASLVALVLAVAGSVAWPAVGATLPPFSSSVRPIDDALRERMASSWRPGCPVPLSDLRYLRLRHVGFDGAAHRGEMVVHRRQAAKVVTVFEELYEQRFPIRRMRLVDDYNGSDARSMRANNTSAFNCRTVGGSTAWSQHAYGRAIDINPVQNPYVDGDRVAPAAGAAYVDRSPLRRGMVTRAVRKAFAAVGWSWGGSWTSVRDYQHFSRSGG